MGRMKTTSLQKRWNAHFSQRLGEIYQKHKVHHGLTLATLGEALGYEEPGRQMRVKRLLNGETECPPETIQELARYFFNASPRKGKPMASADQLEAQLSASAGQQMPALIDELPQKSLDGVLDIIANLSWLAVLNSTQRVQGSKSKNYRWKLIMDELNHIIWGWLAISRLEEEIERLERKSDGDQTGDTPSGRDFLDSMWQEISKGLDQGPTPIQAAYARALWGRVQAWSGATGLSDEMARVALRELEGIVNQSDDARMLVSRARMILADNQRAKGLLNPALALYDTAINDLPVTLRLDSPQRIRLRLKQFNTYLRAPAAPPQSLVQEVWNFRDHEKDPEVLARVHYSLAWYELNKRGTGIERAIEYDKEGIHYAKRTGNIHLEAIGNHYLGDAYFRQGNLPKARTHLEYALGHYQILHYARRGEASYLLGRIFAYLALQAAMAFDHAGWREGITRVESCFNDAEAALSNASQLQGSQISAYQRKQLLVEMAKWGPIDVAVREKLSRQGLSVERLDNPGRVIARARSFLNQADQISYGMEQNYYTNAVIVNNLLIDFVQWYTRLSGAEDEWPSLEGKVAREIRRLETTSLKDNIDLPDDTALIDTVLDGHMARLLAMLGVIRLKHGLDGEQSGIADIRKCADLAAKDFPTMMDCRWVISLSSNKDVLADFDSRLNRERLKMLK